MRYNVGYDVAACGWGSVRINEQIDYLMFANILDL